MSKNEPAWMSERFGLITVAHINTDVFYTVLHALLRAAYQDGRLSVLEEAFKSAGGASLPSNQDAKAEPR